RDPCLQCDSRRGLVAAFQRRPTRGGGGDDGAGERLKGCGASAPHPNAVKLFARRYGFEKMASYIFDRDGDRAWPAKAIISFSKPRPGSRRSAGEAPA